MAKPIRIAIIGSGGIAQSRHVPANDEVDTLNVCTTNYLYKQPVLDAFAAAARAAGCSAALVLALALPATTASARPPTVDPTYGMSVSATQTKPLNPAESADWIWASTTSDNQTVYFRRSFSLKRVPRTAPMWITADDSFDLTVNGKNVTHTVPGPTGANAWQQVTHVDLASYLVSGRNVVAVKSANVTGPAGLLAYLDIPAETAIVTDGSWLVSSETPPSDWTSVSFSADDWSAATIESPVGGGVWGAGAGLDGWPGYQQVQAPYLAHLTLPVEAVVETVPGTGAIDGEDHLAGNKEAVLTVTPPSSGPTAVATSMLLDFGKEVAGRIRITPLTAGEVQVGTGESVGEALNGPWGGVHAMALSPGVDSYTPYSAFRYVHVMFPPSVDPKPVRLRIDLDDTYYPVQYKGSFDCSDPLLTKIWYTGAYTAHLCMQEDIWDGPKRQRARWCGDLNVSGDVINDVFADKFLMEQTLQKLRDDAQGGRAQTDLPAQEVNGIPGYSAAWICTLADFYRHVGDQAYLEKQHALILSLLAYEQQNFNSSNIFVNTNGGWDYVDWSPGFDGTSPESSATTDMVLIRAANDGAFLLKSLGDTANAAKYSAWADALTAAARSAFFDSQSNSYGGRLQENAMAIYSGVATSDQADGIAHSVLDPASNAWDHIGVPPYNDRVITPYYGSYVLRALSRGNDTEDGLQLLRSYWGGMLAEGATTFWEAYDPMWPKVHPHANLYADNKHGYHTSLCHGWSSGPTSWLTERVLGVRPTSGGFATAVIQPELGDLTWAEGTVPTPNGLIQVRADRTNGVLTCRVTLPSGITTTVLLPGRAPETFDHAGVYHIKS